MKRRIFFLIQIALVVMALPALDAGWEWDAGKADSFFYAGDYDAAWLFYERAMTAGADDAKVLYRAAESFSKQQIVENSDFQTALYTTAHYLMMDQYPDDPVAALSASKADPDIIVNRRYIRKTYGMIGAKAPRARLDMRVGLFGRTAALFSSKVEELSTFVSILFTEGIREAFGWARSHMGSLLLAYLLAALVPGIILPTVMAITVAREGRKSYVTAYLFLIYWGPLGIHRFYMGRFLSGIIWLLTGGLLGIGLFFDIFLTGAYIRFWNEDHRGERPYSGEAGGAGVSRRVVSSRPEREAKTVSRVKKTRSPKPAKKPKAPKPPKTGKTNESSVAEKARVKKTVDTDDLFTVSSLTGSGAPSADGGFSPDDASLPDSFNSSAGDDSFDDLPDLDFGDDDFNIPTADGGDDGLAGLAGGADDDEFDLGSLD